MPQEQENHGERVGHTIGQAVGGVRRRGGVVLSVQVAVLSVRAIAEVGPQSMESPVVGRQQLAFRLEAGIC